MSNKALGWITGVIAMAVAVATVAGVAVFFAKTAVDAPSPKDPCSSASAAGSAAILFDLRKPTSAGTSGAVLRDVGLGLGARTELRVYALAGDRLAPRQLLGRLCKPYDNEALAVTAAKDGYEGARDCDDLPAQIGPDLRAAARDYCAQRVALAQRLDVLAAAAYAAGYTVANAYVMEGIEATLRELAGVAAPRTLFVFSDMLQHARWYSHLDLDWSEWGFEDFMPIRDAHDAALFAERPEDLRVRLLYRPREALTDASRVMQAHWSFWRRYFAGADVMIEEGEPQRAYVAEPLMDIGAAITDIVRQRAALQRESRDPEQTLADVREQRRAILSRQREAVATNNDTAARVAELRRDRQAVRAERLRLQSEWAALPPPDAQATLVEVPRAPAQACQLLLMPPFVTALTEERYVDDSPVNHGAGTVVVRYAVTAEGATLDDALTVDQAQSSATMPEHFDTLVSDAFRVVRGWQFGVECGPNAGIGPQGQPGTATFVYRQKCVGAPLPRCRTALAEAAPEPADGT